MGRHWLRGFETLVQPGEAIAVDLLVSLARPPVGLRWLCDPRGIWHDLARIAFAVALPSGRVSVSCDSCCIHRWRVLDCNAAGPDTAVNARAWGSASRNPHQAERRSARGGCRGPDRGRAETTWSC